MRTQQINARVNGGPPVTAVPFGPAATGTMVYAALASTMPTRTREILAALAGTCILEAAPTMTAIQTSTAQATPATAAPVSQPHIRSAHRTCVHVTSTSHRTAPPVDLNNPHHDLNEDSSSSSSSSDETPEKLRTYLKRKRENDEIDVDDIATTDTIYNDAEDDWAFTRAGCLGEARNKRRKAAAFLVQARKDGISRRAQQ